jgi:beta-lactamase regulating signal transducer with metallopeptidase domain
MAAARVSLASMLLGALGLASALFVVVRLTERWRVTAAAASHHISLLGQRLSYPAANFAAVVVLLLALFGLAVIVLVVAGAARELTMSARFSRRMAASARRQLADASVFEDEQPRAFCAGLLRPRVYVSTGAVGALDEPALRAVLLHEHHHAVRRDPLRLAVGRVLSRALFFVPGIRELVRHQQSLAELGADEQAIGAGNENRSALARAMLSFSVQTDTGEPVGIDPARVDHLLGEPPSWRFPALLCVGALAVLAIVATVALLASLLASGSATLAPPFLSNQPCVVMLGMIPATVGLIALWPARSTRRQI